MDPGVVKEVYLAEVSSDVVELLIDLAQGLDRYLKLGNTPLLCQPILSAGSMWLVSQSSNSNQQLLAEAGAGQEEPEVDISVKAMYAYLGSNAAVSHCQVELA